MVELNASLFDTDGFMPHGHCFNWQPALLGIHAVSDSLIALSYLSISLTLVYFVRRGRRQIPFHWMFLAFGAFIVACGLTHAVEVWTLWKPVYWLSGAVKILTALASVPTALLLVPLMPRALALPRDYQNSLAELRAARSELEERVGARTADLERANLGLRDEVAERRKAEGALRLTEERYRELFENANDIVYTLDTEGRFTSLNRAAEQAFGLTREEAGSVRLLDLVVPPAVEEAAAGKPSEPPAGEGGTQSLEIQTRDGRRLHLEVSSREVLVDGRPAGLQVFARDVTERKSLEAQLQQSQKMEAVGRLAGGVAHDFNNALTVIIGYSQLLMNQLPAGESAQQEAAEIHKAAESAANLTRQLLAFSRRQVLRPRVVDLNSVVSGLENMVRRLVGENIELDQRLAPDLFQVKIDPGQMEQVVMNLAVNARDAMPSGGRLTIETRNAKLEETQVRRHPAIKPGWYAMLSVSDSGTGMDPETLSHIFEPFFTTKERGKGTGLGLSTVYGIITQSGGGIWVQSQPGVGSSFKVYLPCIPSEPEAPAAGERQAAAPERAARDPEGADAVSVLVVEDDSLVRPLLVQVLRRHGYRVLEAGSGAEALAMARGFGRRLDALVTDMRLPDRTGREVAAALLAEHPDMRALYLSGYSDSGGAEALPGGGGRPGAFLQKPFAPEELARRLEEILGRAPA